MHYQLEILRASGHQRLNFDVSIYIRYAASAGARELKAPQYNSEAPCLTFKRKQQCIFIHNMHYAHVYVYVCTYTQDKHNDKVLQSSSSLLRNLATVYQTDGVSKTCWNAKFTY